MKNYRSKGQSTARAIKRGNKIVIRDRSKNGGFRVENVPSKNKGDFMKKHRNRMFENKPEVNDVVQDAIKGETENA